jgi:hypothetical protein
MIKVVNMETNISLIIADVPPIINIQIIPENTIIEQYSPRNNKANRKELYSVLYPDTNSDSDSGKSNGTRAVSIIPSIIR